MASQQLKNGILAVCLILFLFSSCDRRKEEINQQVNKLYSSVIDLPYPDMEALSVDSAYFKKKQTTRYWYLLIARNVPPAMPVITENGKEFLKNVENILPLLLCQLLLKVGKYLWM